MPFISASAITPYNSIRGGAAGEALDPILAYSPYNVWDSEHVTIDGDVTTVLDYNNVGAKLNMVNPSAATQPELITNDSSFNNKPFLRFSGTDYLENSIINYRSSDSTGIVAGVMRVNSGSGIYPLTSSSSTVSNAYWGRTIKTSNKFSVLAYNTISERSYVQDNEIIPNGVFSFCYGVDGSDTFIILNAINNGVTYIQEIPSGNTSAWLDSVDARDDLKIGALGTDGSNVDIANVGYYPYTSIADAISLSNVLKTKYGI